jgi:hypothetical protein
MKLYERNLDDNLGAGYISIIGRWSQDRIGLYKMHNINRTISEYIVHSTYKMSNDQVEKIHLSTTAGALLYHTDILSGRAIRICRESKQRRVIRSSRKDSLICTK